VSTNTLTSSPVTLTPVSDFAALGEQWRGLESRADVSFFQSWTWTGCLVEQRFPDPILLEARQTGETVALALFNRRRGLRETLLLGETGETGRDSPFIEFNGVLAAHDQAPDRTEQWLRAARHAAIGQEKRPRLARRVVLSGVEDGVAAAAHHVGPVVTSRSLAAPWVDLRKLRTGEDFLAARSANTRYQIRRSDRAYATTGPVTLSRAATLAEAHGMLDELAALHQAAWTARGLPGAFAHPYFARFHHALIERGLPRDEIDLLRVTAGTQVIGLLYNFRYRGRTSAYQSGFDYAGADRHQKPGLTCHHQAIRFAAAAGLDRYDFLAGDDRYKRSLADGATPLHWIAIGGGGRLGRAMRRIVSTLWPCHAN